MFLSSKYGKVRSNPGKLSEAMIKIRTFGLVSLEGSKDFCCENIEEWRNEKPNKKI